MKSIFKQGLIVFGLLNVLPLQAQIDEKYKDYREVYRDSVLVADTKEVVVQKDTLPNPFEVVANPFRQNWFFFGTAGVHTFWGDYSGDGPFKGTLSPDFGIGFGKWFMPWLALKAEFIRSDSKGYTEYKTAHYGYGDWIEGTPGYRKMKTLWWDLGGSAIINLTRLYYGYEGYGARDHMGQWMAAAGIGAVHHMGYGHDYGSDNELSAHLELQYSRFFTPKKLVSLDIKARGLLYQTNFDLEYGQADHAANHIDANLGLDVGLTFYLGKQGKNGWRRGTSTVYQREYRETEKTILKVKETEVETERPVHSGTITFFVFYPNNYSGRNDAPLVPESSVNALDYLAGGIFTQKQYVDSRAVAARMQAGLPLDGLQAVDLPTEPADQDFAVDFIPRGYEMLEEQPISLSLDSGALAEFYGKAGFYYAPIYDGLHTWQYRIDDATLRQQLVSSENYRECQSFGLNAHSGLETVRRYMGVDSADELVSFADIYAALTSNEGYVSRFTDAETVRHIKDILDRGAILLIQAEGLATSQDNFTGKDAGRVGLERNMALADNRAGTVISWLTSDSRMKDARSQSFIFNNKGDIRTVNDASVRGLNAKLNRCVKVRIRYMVK
ncbi:MAG: hypothetical protein IJ714_02885 [Bacteroidales bacterium]|nr:hypothetical protein [Bacteroidales bacterium]